MLQSYLDSINNDLSTDTTLKKHILQVVSDGFKELNVSDYVLQENFENYNNLDKLLSAYASTTEPSIQDAIIEGNISLKNIISNESTLNTFVEGIKNVLDSSGIDLNLFSE